MKNFHKTYTILFLLSITLLLGAVREVKAQAACDIISAEFRTNRPVNAVFFDDSDIPYVYIDIETSNCNVGDLVKVSIVEEDATGDTEVNGQNGYSDPCTGLSDSCMNKRQILVPQIPNFTLALQAGEDECEQTGNPHCKYYLRTWDEVNPGFQTWQSGLQLHYQCDPNPDCMTDWKYLGVVSMFGGSSASDGDVQAQQNDDNGNGQVPPDGNNGSVPGPDQGSSPLDIGLTNPLAGTIDSIPELFQKIVYLVIKIGIPLVAIAIVYAGFLFVSARGNDEQLKTAKRAFLFAVVGGLILLASWLVAEAVRDALLDINNSI